jgi:hypothetical protein
MASNSKGKGAAMIENFLWSVVEPEDFPKSMYESIFKNFDPEKLFEKKNSEKFIKEFGYDLFSLVIDTTKICCYWNKSDDELLLYKEVDLNNREFIRLANISYDYYLKSCESEFNPLQFPKIIYGDMWETYFWGYPVIEDSSTPFPPERPAQVAAICILLMLDFSISEIKKDGFTKEIVNRLLKANKFLVLSNASDERIRSAQSERNEKKFRAKSGGDAKAAKFKTLEDETVRMYLSGTEKSAPAAALIITPQIVAMSKYGNGDLYPTTSKPLEWIRAYIKAQKSNPC